MGGCALRNMFRRGNGSANKLLDDNFLYGKRSVLSERYFPKIFFEFIENENMLNCVNSLLNSKNLSFHNGSIAYVYPKHLGETKKFHLDTCGFLDDNSVLDPNKYLVNVMVFLDDVDIDGNVDLDGNLTMGENNSGHTHE